MEEKTYRFSIEKKVRKLELQDLFDGFVEGFGMEKFPDPKLSWKEPILKIFTELGKKAGFDVRRELMRIDLTWQIEMPNVSFLELALEYEDGGSSYLTEEVKRKLIHVKSYIKCGVAFEEDESVTEKSLIDIEGWINASEIKDQSKWLFIFIKKIEIGLVTITGYEAVLDADKRKLERRWERDHLNVQLIK